MREHAVGGREAYVNQTIHSSAVGVPPHSSLFCQDNALHTHHPLHCGPSDLLIQQSFFRWDCWDFITNSDGTGPSLSAKAGAPCVWATFASSSKSVKTVQTCPTSTKPAGVEGSIARMLLSLLSPVGNCIRKDFSLKYNLTLTILKSNSVYGWAYLIIRPFLDSRFVYIVSHCQSVIQLTVKASFHLKA